MSPLDSEAIATKYLATLNKRDLDGVLKMFSNDVSLEDPYGTPAVNGKENIVPIFERVFRDGLKVQDIGSLHCAGDTVAMTYTIVLPTVRFKTITLIRLNQDGEIFNLRAYWSGANILSEQLG